MRGVSKEMLLLPVHMDQFLESYYKHAMCQQLPINCSGTLGMGLWVCLGWYNYSNYDVSGGRQEPRAEEVNTHLSYETGRK